MNFLSGNKILEEKFSPVSGKITVVKGLGLGTYIQVSGLTQSGGVVEEIWKSALGRIKNCDLRIKSVLILGLGGGTAGKLVRKFWPETKIIGVEIDPIMIDLGNRHLALGESSVEILIGDAYQFCKASAFSPITSTSDLILVDLYVGDRVPRKFETNRFLKLVDKLLLPGGIAVFNRLYFGEKRKEAMRFAKKLEKIFVKVEYFYPHANVMFVCSN